MPRQLASPRADRRSQTAADLHRSARAGPPTHAAARLLRRFQSRPALGQARHAGRSAQGVAAAEPARDRAVSQVMSELDYTDALAAGYVLGTLDFEERMQARTLLDADQAFAAKVELWERRFGELHLMVEPVEPEAAIWTRIKAKMPEVRQKMQPPAPEVAPPAPAPTASEPPSLDAIEAAISQATTTLTSEANSARATEPAPSPMPEGMQMPASQATPAPASEARPAPSSEATPAPASGATSAPASEATLAPALEATLAPASEATPGPASEATSPPASEATPAPASEATSPPPLEVTPAPASEATSPPALEATSAPPLEPTSASISEAPAPAPAQTAAVEPASPAPVAPPAAAALETPSETRIPSVEPATAAVHRRMRRWRAFAILMTLVVAAVAALLAAWRFAPDRVPPMLQPVELMRQIGVPLPSTAAPRRPAPPESQFDE